jgi:tripartite-type tricarboxylate transporter receptor subunit TctC
MRACKRDRQALLCSAVVALLAGPLPVAAQVYPSRPVRYIVPFPAGASPDIVGRTLGERLSKIWGHQVLVDNRSGAGGTVGAAIAAKSPPDGHTLFQCNIASSAIALSLYSKPGYDHQRDFAPISRIGMTPNVLIVHPSMPARSIKAYIALARAHPAKLSYASSAAGTSPQLAMELLKLLTRIEILHISYKGSTQAVADVIGGQVPSGMTNVPALLAPLQAGRLRALAVTGPHRITQLPDVPTMQEAGLPGYDVTSWYGLCAPAATPVPILEKLHSDLTAVLRMPEIRKRFTDLVIDIAPTSRDEFGQFMSAETERWAQVIREAKIPVQ